MSGKVKDLHPAGEAGEATRTMNAVRCLLEKHCKPAKTLKAVHYVISSPDYRPMPLGGDPWVFVREWVAEWRSGRLNQLAVMAGLPAGKLWRAALAGEVPGVAAWKTNSGRASVKFLCLPELAVDED